MASLRPEDPNLSMLPWNRRGRLNEGAAYLEKLESLGISDGGAQEDLLGDPQLP